MIGKVNASFDVVEVVKSYVLSNLKTYDTGDDRELIYNRAFIWSGEQKAEYYKLKDATRSEKEKEILQSGLNVEVNLFDKSNIKNTLSEVNIDFEEDAGYLYLNENIQKQFRFSNKQFKINDKIECIAMPDAIVFDKTRQKYVVIDCKASTFSKCQVIQRNKLQSACELQWVVENWEQLCERASECCSDFIKSKIELSDLIGCVYYANDKQTDFVEASDFERMRAEIIKSFDLFVEDIDNKKFKKREPKDFFEKPEIELPDNIFDDIITGGESVEDKFGRAFEAFEAEKEAKENLKLAKAEADKYYGAIKKFCFDNKYYFNITTQKQFESGLSITINKTKDVVKTPEEQVKDCQANILTDEQIEEKLQEFKQTLLETKAKAEQDLKELQEQYASGNLADVIVRNGSISIKVND